MVAARQPATYGRLLRVPGFAPLIASALLTRISAQMWTITIVLFALQRLHSPGIAGLSVFLLIFPGLMLSPITGALLDRYGRRRLMVLDFAVAAGCLLLIIVLESTNHLPPWLLLLILAVGSLTSTLSIAGARSLFPLTVPRDLWDRANAADSLCYGLAGIAGPGLAGGLTAWMGIEVALGVVALGYVLAALALLKVREPQVEKHLSGSVARDAWRGLRYVVSNPSLRWLAVSLSLTNVGMGIVIVALPVLVFRLNGSAAVVGGILAVQGVVGVPATLLAGRLRTDGRERPIMAAALVLTGVTTLALLVPALGLMAVAFAAMGLATGPLDVALFSLRQRRTHRAWFGRAFAISMSLNFAGMPLGSALSGLLIKGSLTIAIIVAAVLPLVSAAVIMTMIPPRHQDPSGP